MKALIVTVAGTATRFNQDTTKDTLKCIYYEEFPEYSLLSQILEKSDAVDKVIIVGGYMYSELISFIDLYLSSYKYKIEVVYNELYNVYGSGYSLIKGVQALDSSYEEIIFVEGDLFFDDESYLNVLNSFKNVITINREPIIASKSVVLYMNEADQIRYIYDLSHNTLLIPEPIKAIYNSAQIWKFISYVRLKEVIDTLDGQQIEGTNLEIINKYFQDISPIELDILPMEKWYNCNTVKDYLNVYSEIKNNNVRF